MTKETEEFLDKYKTDFASNTAADIFVILDGEAKKRGKAYSESLGLSFIMTFLATFIYRKISAEKIAMKNILKASDVGYYSLKSDIQHSIGKAFELAIQAHSGLSVEHYCNIQQVKEPSNTLPC